MKIILIILGILILGLAFYGLIQLKKNIFPSVKKDAQDIGNKLKS